MVTKIVGLKGIVGGSKKIVETIVACQSPKIGERSPYLKYVIYDGSLFMRKKVCILNSFMRESTIKEMHNDYLEGGCFFPSLKRDVPKCVL
jgi:hypothetical protein